MLEHLTSIAIKARHKRHYLSAMKTAYLYAMSPSFVIETVRIAERMKRFKRIPAPSDIDLTLRTIPFVYKDHCYEFLLTAALLPDELFRRSLLADKRLQFPPDPRRPT